MRFKFHILKIYFAALILLPAILNGVFSLALFTPAAHSSAEMVYCPLTRKLQPVNPPKTVLPANSLNEICASDFEKNNFAAAIIKNAKIKSSNISQADFENLVFDFWQNGKSALDNLPQIPNLPEKFLAKNSFSTIGFGNDFENKIARKTAEKFIFQLKPRPPTKQNSLAFEFKTTPKLNQISRQISPRAPPVSV